MEIAEEYLNARCFECKHLVFSPAEFYCPAFDFEEGIPEEILIGENDHSSPLPGQDNKIVFEQKTEE